MLIRSKNRNNKFFYYAGNYLAYGLPNGIYRHWKNRVLDKKFDSNTLEKVLSRVNLYNRLPEENLTLSEEAIPLSEYNPAMKYKTYFFDFYKYARAFDQNYKVAVQFGDVNQLIDYPVVVKSRPLKGQNEMSVLMKLNLIRHYFFIKDSTPYQQKKDRLIWRGHSNALKPLREDFLNKYFNNPQCNVGNTNKRAKDSPFYTPEISKQKQLEYKFIFCPEGVDVSTSIKWVMSSNSLAVSTQPVFESWYMEGRLIPGVHYVKVRDDMSDLEEKMEYYLAHPQLALEIIENANAYTRQFQNSALEDLISFLVLEKYLVRTGQKKREGYF
nr:hypothetical protein [Saprospiraceae bacterium]